MIRKLYYIVIRVPKEHSAFTYFQLEANEGLAFYSTLSHKEGEQTRDIELTGPEELRDELKRLLNILSQEFRIETLKEETLNDL